MLGRKYTIDDLLQLAKLGRFGTYEMNSLAASAFMALRDAQRENDELKKRLNSNDGELNMIHDQGAPQTKE